MPKTLIIKIPDLIVDHYGVEDLERSLFEDIVIGEFQKGHLSIRDGADLLGMTYEKYIEFLAKKGIPLVNATPEELEKSYKNFENFMQKISK